MKNSTNKLNEDYRWIPEKQPITVHGYKIECGMIYVGTKMPDSQNPGDDNACLINPELVLGMPMKEKFADHYSYSKSPPGFRRTYLEWLASGRNDPDVHPGCLMCFLYGLEQRLLVDGAMAKLTPCESTQILQEIIRLVNSCRHFLQFIDYARYLLVCEWLVFSKKDSFPEYLCFDMLTNKLFFFIKSPNSFAANKSLASYEYRKTALLLTIFQHIIKDRPFSYTDILRFTLYYPENTPNIYHADSEFSYFFQYLFSLRFKEKFGSGVRLKRGAVTSKIRYLAANPSLKYLELPVSGLPDNLFDGDGLLEESEKLIDNCEKELKPYWNNKFRSHAKRLNNISALLLLPKELICEDRKIKKLNKFLLGHNFQKPRIFSVLELYKQLDYIPSEKNKKKDFQNMVLFLKYLNFGVAPDKEMHGADPGVLDKLLVFPSFGKIRAENKDFRKFCLIIRLDSLKNPAHSDFTIHHKKFLQYCRNLNNEEKNSLYAFSMWQQKQSTILELKGIKPLLADFSLKELQEIALIIMWLGGAERNSPDGIKRLEYIYKKLNLGKSQLIKDLNMFENKKGSADLWDKNRQKKGFSLNEALLQKYEAETDAVCELLTAVFSDDNIQVATAPASVLADKPEVQDENYFNGLDAIHRQLFLRIVKKENWSKKELQKLCHGFDLMLDGALENINQWFMERTEYSLIEGDGPFHVDIELVEEVKNLSL